MVVGFVYNFVVGQTVIRWQEILGGGCLLLLLWGQPIVMAHKGAFCSFQLDCKTQVKDNSDISYYEVHIFVVKAHHQIVLTIDKARHTAGRGLHFPMPLLISSTPPPNSVALLQIIHGTLVENHSF